MNKKFTKRVLYNNVKKTLLLTVIIFTIIPSITNAAVKLWRPIAGGSGNTLWSTAANWSPSGVPGVSDIATFDGTDVSVCTMDAGSTCSEAHTYR